MRFLKILLKVLGGFVLLIVILLAFMVTTVDDTPYKEMAYYQQWKKSVGGLQLAVHSPQSTDSSPPSFLANISLGWAVYS